MVNIGGVKLQDFQVQAAQITEIDIPYNKAYLGDRTTQNTTQGIQVIVDDADPAVVVYAHIYADARSEATLLLPIEGLGSSYYAMGWRPKDPNDARFVFNIVAITETTTVIIQQRINNALSSTLTVTLNHVGDVYQFVGNADENYTGTHVKVDPTNSDCKTFAMFSGDNLAYIPSTALTGDPLFQQL